MGVDNRQRRKAKEKARRAKAATRSAATGPAFGPLPPVELAHELALQAFDALAVGDERAYAAVVDDLTTGRGRPKLRAAANRMLFERRDDYLKVLWANGWQPAELYRYVQRQGDGAQAALALDGMAAEIRRYAEATVDERWSAQLAALDAQVWWTHDDTYLDELSARSERTLVIDAWLRMLDTLTTAPPLPALLPPPGTGRRGSLVADPRRDIDQRMLEKVRGLLAKAESTSYEAEAETYTAKAQELMTRHSIDYALLAAQTGARDEPVARRIAVDGPYEAEKVDLLAVIARANLARAVWLRTVGLVTVVGFPGDLDAVEVLFTSLLVQATRAMTQAGAHRDAAGRSRTRSFRQSFLAGFAMRIGERLNQASQDATDAAVGAAGSGLLPVLASREEKVEQAVQATFGDGLRYVPGPRINNGHGFHSGVAAADRASLHGKQALPGGR